MLLISLIVSMQVKVMLFDTWVRVFVCSKLLLLNIESMIDKGILKMRKTIFAMAPAAVILLAATNYAHAATNAQLTVTANVVASTCDVSLSTSNLDLGNFSPKSFKAAGVAKPVSESQKTFTVGLSDCETPEANATAGLMVSGQTLAGNPNIFNASGTNTGVMLSSVANADQFFKNGEKLVLAKANGTDPAAGDFNGKTVSLKVGLAAASTDNIDIGTVSAPILFSFAYN